MGGPPERRLEDANHAALSLFSAIVALAVAGIGLLLRLGFSDNSPLEWAKFVGLSWFLIHFSLVARTVLRTVVARNWCPWWSSHAILTLAALALTALAGAGWPSSDPATSELNLLTGGSLALFCILGATGLILALAVLITRARLRQVAVLMAFAGLFSFYAAGAAWGTGNQHPLFVEDLCLGRASIDTLFHSSIGNMLRTYGVSSTGLDGLPVVPYHYGSHWLFARLCNVLNVRVIDFYNRGYAVVFVPFGVFSLGTFALALVRKWRGFSVGPTTRAAADAGMSCGSGDLRDVQVPAGHQGVHPIGACFWFVLSVGYIGFLPFAARFMPIVGLNSIIVSESYAVAVAVSLLTISAARSFFGDVLAEGGPRTLAVLAGAVVFAALVAAIGILKISVMLVLLAAGAYLFVRLRLYRKVLLDLLAAAVAIGAWGAYEIASDPGYVAVGESQFAAFGFPRSNVEPQWWPDYWFIYYAWMWIFAAARFREESIRTLYDLAMSWRACRLLDVEFVFFAALVGAGPGLLTMFSGTHYFSNYQQWLALGAVLAIAVRYQRSFAMASPIADHPDIRRGLGRLTIGRLFAGLVILTVAGTLFSNTLVLLKGLTATNLAARGHAAGQTGIGTALMRGRLTAAAGILRQTAADLEFRMKTDKSIVVLLSSLDAMPLAEKRRSLLFIPKSNGQFWDLLHGPYWPKDGPFVGPALSGVAMIDGLYVPAADDPWIGYGYHHYPKEAAIRAQPPLAEYLPKLRSRSAHLGFSQLIVIDGGRAGTQTLSKYQCP